MLTWYLMYSGISADGRQPPKYLGRTIDPKVALAHFRKVKADPYNSGSVTIITDKINTNVWEESDIKED